MSIEDPKDLKLEQFETGEAQDQHPNPEAQAVNNQAAHQKEVNEAGAATEPEMEVRVPANLRRPPQSAEDLLLQHIPQRAQYAGELLRRQLTGTVLVKLRDGREKYLFDWTKPEATVTRVEGDQADCSLALSEDNLMQIARGRLNPQIAMLSEKIVAGGNLGLAIYFFNLVAPRSA